MCDKETFDMLEELKEILNKNRSQVIREAVKVYYGLITQKEAMKRIAEVNQAISKVVGGER
ncbi:MAG: ribbon-helix-helix protein, CopG family [Methermicoccaceae archaeon]